MVKVIFPHCISAGPDILTDPDWLEVHRENELVSVHRPCYLFPYFFSKPGSQFSSLIILASGDEVRQEFTLLAFKSFEKIVLAVYAKSTSIGRQGDYLKIRDLGSNTRTRYVSMLIDTISGKFLEYVKIFYEFCNEIYAYVQI
ncbi:MAG: hypothetical protein J1E84_07505 [Muribaculaceae bacterium]|nr:hypothetical protein [Muribaculaceae bacterium]